MRYWREVLIGTILFCLTSSVFLAHGATVPSTGFFIRADCATISNPVANSTACLQTTAAGGRNAGQVYVWNGSLYSQITGGSGAAPVDATYITQTPNAVLNSEQALSVLSTGLLKSTTATGVVSTAVAGTDFAAAPTGTANTPLFNNGSGGFTNGTRVGNTTAVATGTGSFTTDNCVKTDANHNVIDAGAPCGTGSGTITALTGDVTASGSGSVTATIANQAVTLAKIANAAASSRLLGSGSSGSGASYSELTVGGNLAVGASSVDLAAAPSITTSLTTPKLTVSTEVILPVTEVTMSGTLTLVAGTSTTYQFLDPNGSDRQVNLPVVATGMAYLIMNFGSANILTIKDNGGSTVTTITFGSAKTFIYSGSAWRTL